MKPESPLRGTTSRLTHPGQGCPQRSQLQSACASASRSGNTSNAMFFNISLVVSASSVNNRVVFIESLLVRLNAIAAAAARLCIYWVLLCKNCRDPAAFEHGQYTRALKVSENSALDRVARTRRKRLRDFVVAVALVPSGTSASLLRDLLAINPATHRQLPTSNDDDDACLSSCRHHTQELPSIRLEIAGQHLQYQG